MSVLLDVLGMPKDRAASALRVVGAMPSLVTHDLVSGIAGVKASLGITRDLIDLLPAKYSRDSGAPAREISLATALKCREVGRIRAVAMSAARSDDRATQFAAVALIASLNERWSGIPTDALVDALVADPSRRAPRRSRDADRILGLAYGVDALNEEGLQLGGSGVEDGWWATGNRPWRWKAAPWVLSVVDPKTPAAVSSLLTALHERGLGFARPGTDPFQSNKSVDDVERALNVLEGHASALTSWTDQPIWLEETPETPQILILEDDNYAYAWVGRKRKGVLVALSTGPEGYYAFGLPEPGVPYAVIAAVGWYIDTRITLRPDPHGNSYYTRKGFSRKDGLRYRPTNTFAKQHREVVSGSRLPPEPHSVRGHIRRLPPGKKPSDKALAAAPPRIRLQMRRRDTFVAPHTKGSRESEAAVRTRLSKFSALADLLGLRT